MAGVVGVPRAVHIPYRYTPGSDADAVQKRPHSDFLGGVTDESNNDARRQPLRGGPQTPLRRHNSVPRD